jgi:hypothetical protein
MQSADLLAGKEGTADPTALIELIQGLAELEEAGAVADAAAMGFQVVAEAHEKAAKAPICPTLLDSTTFYVNVSTLTYLTDPLKTLTFALFWPQIPPKTTKIR